MTAPGELLNIGPEPGQNHFNVGIARPGTHEDFGLMKIAAGWSWPGFTANATGDAVVFRAPMNGGTTSSGTKYPRSELRELNPDGTKAAWHGGKGTHWVEGTSRVLHLPPRKPWVVICQVHNGKSDLVRVQTEGLLGALRLVARNTPPGGTKEEIVVVAPSYTLGDVIRWRIEVKDGVGALLLDGAVVRVFPADMPGCYFKAGAYAQTNVKDVGESPDEYAEVEILAGSLFHWHPGWPMRIKTVPAPVPEVPSPRPVPAEPSTLASGPPEKPVEPVLAPTPTPPACPSSAPVEPPVPAWVQVLIRWLRKLFSPRQ